LAGGSSPAAIQIPVIRPWETADPMAGASFWAVCRQ